MCVCVCVCVATVEKRVVTVKKHRFHDSLFSSFLFFFFFCLSIAVLLFPPPPPSPNAQEGEREGGGRGGRGGKKTITAVQRERCVISDYSSLSVTVIRRES